MSCRHGWDREERRAWKEARRDEWRAQKEHWRDYKRDWRTRHSRPGYGWHPINIAAMVLGFIIFFPIGLAILFWNIWSSRNGAYAPAFANMSMPGFGAAPWSGVSRDLARNSGNSVFEDYKRATLERLEEERRKLVAEQEAFGSFLDDLKKAKDRDEFEHFMREREEKRAADARDVGPAN
jgi:hypothetical protein